MIPPSATIAEIDPATAKALVRYRAITYVHFLKELNPTFAAALNLASEHLWPENGGRRYSPSTIEDWWYSYSKCGFNSLLPRRRSDKGSVKALTVEEGSFVSKVAEEQPDLAVPEIHKRLRETRSADSATPSLPTLYRYLKAHGLDYHARIKLREAASKPANEAKALLWMLDVLQGRMPLSQLASELKGSLSEADVEQLYEYVKNKPLRFRNHALAVLCKKRGIRKPVIQHFLKVGVGYVDFVVPLYNDGGVERITVQRHSSPKKCDQQSYKDEVFAILHSPPAAHGINRTTWRRKDIQDVMTAKGLPIGCAGISKIVRDAHYSFRKAKSVLTSSDPGYKQKLKEITNILRKLKPTEKFFSVDEYGPFAVKLQGGRSLVAPGQCKVVPQYQKSKGNLILTAALELSENQITHFYSEKKNTNEMLKLLDILVAKYADQDRIYFSWDAASWHGSKRFTNRVLEIDSAEYRATHKIPLVELAPLPSRAQFLNVIKSVFSGMARAIIHNSEYRDVQESKTAIDRYFAERNEHFRNNPRRAGNKIWGEELVPPIFNEANNCKDPRYQNGPR